MATVVGPTPPSRGGDSACHLGTALVDVGQNPPPLVAHSSADHHRALPKSHESFRVTRQDRPPHSEEPAHSCRFPGEPSYARARLGGMSLREAWEAHADEWVGWARTPGHDSYWLFHRDRFLELLPRPGRLTVDVGCGEGRLGRDLMGLGHRVLALDASPTLARACAGHPLRQTTVVADAARLPLRPAVADLVVAFMSLHDVDDYRSAVREAARVLRAPGRLCVALVHPINSAGRFEGRRGDVNAPFVIRGSYLESFRYRERAERDDLGMTFHSEHRPLEAYSRALEEAGFLIEAIREVTEDDSGDRWHRLPLFLHLRALLPEQPR